MPPTPRATFPKTLHLAGPATFRAHYAHGHRETAGPLVALALASPHPYTRLGLSVPNKVGPATTRNWLRRVLREAFRLSRATHPEHVDLVLLIRPHKEKPLAEYQQLLATLLTKVTRQAAATPLPTVPPAD
jgi:ribonuclease P protein component